MPVKVSSNFRYVLKNQLFYFCFITTESKSIEKSTHSFEESTKAKIRAKFKRKMISPTSAAVPRKFLF